MYSRLFHGLFILILFLSLSSISIALTKAHALEAVLYDDPQSETWQLPKLLKLAKEFRQWRRPFYQGAPDYTQLAKEQLKGLKEFRCRLDSINPRSWPASY